MFIKPNTFNEVYVLSGNICTIFLKTKKTIMKLKNLFWPIASVALIFSLLFSSCQKNESAIAAKNSLSVYLTDAPGDFDSVWIDIQKVEVKIDDDSTHGDDDRFGDDDDDRDDHLKRKDDFGEWVDLNFTAGKINVLALRNGIDTNLASGNIPAGTVRKIRITLGTDNSVVIDGQSYPLTLRNETNNFLYIKLRNEHRERGIGNDQKVWVDFDISRSIIEENGAYYLLPKLRPFCDRNFGRISGKVLPEGITPSVTFNNGNGFTAIAIPAPDGEFKVRGLPEGTYSVTYAAAGYTSQTVDITISKGNENKLETITLVP